MDKAIAIAPAAILGTLGVTVAQSLGIRNVWYQLGIAITLCGVGIFAGSALGGKKTAAATGA